jgi:hypothetical protein
MAKRYHLKDRSRLAEVQAWVADPNNRTVLITSQSGPVTDYHLVLDTDTWSDRALAEEIVTALGTAITEDEFPR